MINLSPLWTLLLAPRPQNASVSFGAGGERDWASFRGDVSSLVRCIQQSQRMHWLIATEDAYALAVGLFATLHAGGTAYLPANHQEGHLAALAADVDGVLTYGDLRPVASVALGILERDNEGALLPLVPLDAASATIVLHTSGTTDAPKPLPKALSCLDAEVATLEQIFGPLCSGNILATVPPYHIYGLLFRVLWPLASGRPFADGTVRFPGELDAADCKRPKATLISSPAFLKRVVDSLDLESVRDRLGTVFSSGGPLPGDVAARYAEYLEHPIVEVYGSTETGGIAHRSVLTANEIVPWTVFPNIAISTSEKSGLLSIKSPFTGVPDWYVTSDRVELLPGGRFLLQGRADRIVKLEERRISLDELEGRLARCPEVESVRVLALVGAEGDRSVLGAVVVPTEMGWNLLAIGTKRAFTERLRSALEPFVDELALPRKWRIVRSLPTTGHGKIANADLAALFAPNCGRKQLPRVLREHRDGYELQVRLALEADLLFFEGHFEAAPILAGIVQLDWAIRFAQDAFAISDHPNEIEALKFFRVLPAGSEVDLKIVYDQELNRMSFHYVVGDEVCSSGRAAFQPGS